MRTLVLSLLTLFLMAGAVASKSLPESVEAVLDSAGDNRAELEAVIEHYQASADSLKLQAAYFLIGNMEDHSYVTYRWYDTSDVTVEFDVMDYENFNSLLDYLKTIEEKQGEIDYGRDELLPDPEVITSEFLISNIDLAFEVWLDRPWAKWLSFDQFCQYVLPYRGSNEPLEDWRSYFVEKYRHIGEQAEGKTDVVTIASLINKDVRSYFTFDERYYLHPTDQGLSEMLASGLGRCEDMTNLSIFALRANGIAVTSDYTPAWANTGNNHAWNAILTEDGSVVPFMGAEADPGQYELANRAAKVYRKTFDIQPDNLIFQDQPQEALPGWLRGKNYQDVTAEYYDVFDVTLELEDVPDSVGVAYICVFNSGDWTPIHWGLIDGNEVTFTDMNSGVLYLPAYYLDEEIVPAGAPIILDGSGELSYLWPSDDDFEYVDLTSVPIRAMAASSETVKKAPLQAGTEYRLLVWDGEDWAEDMSFVAEEGKVTRAYPPTSAVLWLVAEDGDENERIFTVEDGKQMFW